MNIPVKYPPVPCDRQRPEGAAAANRPGELLPDSAVRPAARADLPHRPAGGDSPPPQGSRPLCRLPSPVSSKGSLIDIFA